jgi:membrane-associated phospholipid phosphatase
MSTLGTTPRVHGSADDDVAWHRPSFGRPLARVPWMLLGCLVVASIAIEPFDGWLTARWRGLELPGDVDQELRFLQQFGQIGSLVLVAILVCCLQRPAIRRTLLDLGLAVLIGTLIANLLKTEVGRLRPAFGDADAFLGQWWTRANNDYTWTQRASMPSSHTVAAAVLATWMWIVCPRLRVLGVVLATLVGIARVRVGAHWPTDVLLGGALGVFCGSVVIGRLWSTRLLDVIWRRMVDRDALPASPDVRAAVERLHSPRRSA